MAKRARQNEKPLEERLRQLVTELMLIPGLSGYEGRVRRYLAKELRRSASSRASTGSAT